MKQKSLKVTLSALSLSVALLASGQAMATAYYSRVANPVLASAVLTLTDWSEAVCGATMAVATTAFSGTTDTLTICGTGSLALGVVTGVTGAIRIAAQ